MRSSTRSCRSARSRTRSSATICNHNLQAVVIRDGFEYRSRHDVPMLREFLLRHLHGDEASTEPGALATALARAVKRYRPELDVYLLTDRAVEELAGSDEAAMLRRIFHNVEELMELHLAILDGISDRYETPFFNNLKKYAQRPIGTFHALPIARGKSVFRSNWIRDMGHFYGTNLFLAESSATTGGLDSLLEPTGNIKKAQELTARAFGAKRAYFATNGTSTSNKIVVQAICKPGDIVIVDRNCHKSHHYGSRAVGRAAVLRRGVSADAVLDVRRRAADGDQEGAARLPGAGHARPASR